MKDTGLKNTHEQYLRCFYTSGTYQNMINSAVDAETWEPDFSGDGESLVHWRTSGNSRNIFIKDSHEQLPTGRENWMFTFDQIC
jgi:hypothetical protein